MTSDEFLASVDRLAEPPPLSPALRALWLVKKGRWDDAHDVVNELATPMGSWIHAHLHRIEGDLGNAGYWYARAGRPAVGNRSDLDAEWNELVAANL
jgi:hypothetical protein